MVDCQRTLVPGKGVSRVAGSPGRQHPCQGGRERRRSRHPARARPPWPVPPPFPPGRWSAACPCAPPGAQHRGRRRAGARIPPRSTVGRPTPRRQGLRPRAHRRASSSFESSRGSPGAGDARMVPWTRSIAQPSSRSPTASRGGTRVDESGRSRRPTRGRRRVRGRASAWWSPTNVIGSRTPCEPSPRRTPWSSPPGGPGSGLATSPPRPPERRARPRGARARRVDARGRVAAHTPMAALSRGVAGTVGAALVVNLPGSPAGVREGLEAILPVVPARDRAAARATPAPTRPGTPGRQRGSGHRDPLEREAPRVEAKAVKVHGSPPCQVGQRDDDRAGRRGARHPRMRRVRHGRGRGCRRGRGLAAGRDPDPHPRPGRDRGLLRAAAPAARAVVVSATDVARALRTILGTPGLPGRRWSSPDASGSTAEDGPALASLERGRPGANGRSWSSPITMRPGSSTTSPTLLRSPVAVHRRDGSRRHVAPLRRGAPLPEGSATTTSRGSARRSASTSAGASPDRSRCRSPPDSSRMPTGGTGAGSTAPRRIVVALRPGGVGARRRDPGRIAARAFGSRPIRARSSAQRAASSSPTTRPFDTLPSTVGPAGDAVARSAGCAIPTDHWVTFTHAFLDTPLCCPSRASILTGLTRRRTRVCRPTPTASISMSPRRWRRGWTTPATRPGLIGKYLNDFPWDRGPYVPAGWDRFVAKQNQASRDDLLRLPPSSIRACRSTVGHATRRTMPPPPRRRGARLPAGRARGRTVVPAVHPDRLRTSPGCRRPEDAGRSPGGPSRRPSRAVLNDVRGKPGVGSRAAGDRPPTSRRCSTAASAPRARDPAGRRPRGRVPRRRRSWRRGELDRTLIVVPDRQRLLVRRAPMGRQALSRTRRACARPSWCGRRGRATRTSTTPVTNVDLAPTIMDLAGVHDAARCRCRPTGMSLRPWLGRDGRCDGGPRGRACSCECAGDDEVPAVVAASARPISATSSNADGTVELYDLTGAARPRRPSRAAQSRRNRPRVRAACGARLRCRADLPRCSRRADG